MARAKQPDKLKTRIDAIACFYRETGRMPSFSELGELVELKSKNAVSEAPGVRKRMGV